MRTLFERSCDCIRQNWHLYDQSTQKMMFDLIWRDRVYKLGKSPVLHLLRDFCADMSREKWILKNLSNKERASYHETCEQLGLNHTSNGPKNRRVLTILKLPEWRWEYTDRPVQKKPRYYHPPRDMERERAREDYEDACFQVYCKYRAYGYNSPDDMLHHEHEMRELIEQAQD